MRRTAGKRSAKTSLNVVQGPRAVCDHLVLMPRVVLGKVGRVLGRGRRSLTFQRKSAPAASIRKGPKVI